MNYIPFHHDIHTRKIAKLFAKFSTHHQNGGHTSNLLMVDFIYTEIHTYTIAIGSGWNKYSLICLGSSENGYEGLISSISDPSTLPTILTNLEAITCPR